MATLPVWQKTIVDNQGRVIPNAPVDVKREDGKSFMLYADRNGDVVLQPNDDGKYEADGEGFLRFFAESGAYRISVEVGSLSREWQYVQLWDVYADTEFENDITFGGDNTFTGDNTFDNPVTVGEATEDEHAVRFSQAATIKTIIEYGTPLGQYIYMPGAVKQPSEYDSADPDSYWPAVCLDDIDRAIEITETNWPKLPGFLRDIALIYQDYEGGERKSQFDVTDYDISSGTATLTFANADAENAMFDAIMEDGIVHGSFSHWITITLPDDIGGISAGDYAITDVDNVSRTISFSTSASDDSGSVTEVAEIYPHRIPGSSTSARLYQVTSRTVASAGYGEDIAGLRRRDQMQKIRGEILASTQGGKQAVFASGGGAFSVEGVKKSSIENVGSGHIDRHQTIGFDSSDSPSARTTSGTDGYTRGRELVGHIYMWAREYKE